jgi:HlyD family type I secretion membrane fusion protein
MIEMRGQTLPVVSPRPVSLPPVPSLKQELEGTAWLGMAIILLFFGAFGGWAATAPLSGAVIANGAVSPEGSRRTVQHLEGGIIDEIRVREGDTVAEGDVLMVLHDVHAQAEVGAQMIQLRSLAATEARLRAERTGNNTIHFDYPVLADRDDPDVRSVIAQQINQFETRKENDRTRESTLIQKIAQLEQQITGATRQLEGVKRQTELIREEIVGVKELYEKGYERKPRLLALQRAEAELLGTEGELVSRIAEAQEAIGETKLEIINLKTDRVEKVDADLADTQAKRIELEKQIKEGLDRLKRTVIRAPISGAVLNLKFKTIGGVIRAGDPVLDIVPTDEDLVIDARIAPNDIDDVHADLKAYVMFPSFPQRNLLRLDGRVGQVSADALQDERTGQHYFTAKVRVDRAHLEGLAPNLELVPGMPAEVFIATVERTFLEYLVQPILQTIERSFREH